MHRIIHTAASAKLSLAHGAAAWNALYGFLELSSLSSDARLRELSFASTTWISVFELFLSRSQNAKAKPLRQFLHTWTNLLSKQPDPAVQASLKEQAVTSTVTMIIDQNDFSLVKPAFQVLEHFLHKGVIVSFDIIREVARICTNGTESNNIYVRISTEKSGELDPESLSPIEILSLIEAFALRVFEWLRYPDIAPIAGRLLQSFFKHSQGSKFRDSQPKIKAPLWVAPLREFLENEPSMFETCEAHVLPGLLDLSFNDTLAFLETLPVQALQEGNAESLTLLEIQLCLAALKISSNTPTGTYFPLLTCSPPSLRSNRGNSRSCSKIRRNRSTVYCIWTSPTSFIHHSNYSIISTHFHFISYKSELDSVSHHFTAVYTILPRRGQSQGSQRICCPNGEVLRQVSTCVCCSS